jgi:hypothetical protein
MNIVFVACFFVGLVLVCWSWWRTIKDSTGQARRPTLVNEAVVVAEYRAAFTQEEVEMYGQMAKLLQTNHFAEAAVLVDKLLPVLPDDNSEGYASLLHMKLYCLLNQNQIEQVERLCLDYIQQDVSQAQKVTMLDAIASYILHRSSSPFLKQAERFARLGLEIAPGTLTLKGTLGSILVEKGNFVEGELLLHDCLHGSNALHDRAISSFYLGVIKMRNGDAKGGKRLMKRGMKMYPEAWIVAKGNVLLKDSVEGRVP